MKIIYGSVKPDEGSVHFNGQTVQVRNPQRGTGFPIAMVFQHFSLFDTLTVAENVWLGLDKEPDAGRSDQPHLRQGRRIMASTSDPLRPVHTLECGRDAAVEIIRALLTNPKLLILDEATSVLTPQAVENRGAAPVGVRGLLAFSTSATSCTKFARCALLEHCAAGAARSPGCVTLRKEASASCRA